MVHAETLPPTAALSTARRKLRSVEAAAHVLQSFEQIQTQGAIQRQMTDKLTDVLEHFIREVRAGKGGGGGRLSIPTPTTKG